MYGILVAVFLLAAIANQQIFIWDLQTKMEDSISVLDGVPVSYDHKYASKKEFEQEKKNVEQLGKMFQNRRPQIHEWDKLKQTTQYLIEKTEKIEDLTGLVYNFQKLQTSDKNVKIDIQETHFQEVMKIFKKIEDKFEIDKERRESRMKDQEVDFYLQLDKLERTSEEKLKEIKEALGKDFGKKLDSLHSLVQEVETTLYYFEEKYDNDKIKTEMRIKEQEEEFKRQVDELERTNIKKLKDLKEALERDFGQKLDSLDPLVKEVKSKVDDVLMPNAFNKQNVIIAFFLLVLILGLVMLSINNYDPKKEKDNSIGNSRPAVQRNSSVSTLSQNPILNEITPNRPLQNQLCVVSFGDNTPDLHVTLVEQALHGLSMDMERKYPLVYHTIRRHEQIVQLPPVKLYLVFIHFSERHVIIEEPFTGQGDIRRTTVQAITKFGGDYIIVYVNDPGSKQLPPDSRYNSAIYTVKRQAELKELDQRGRFFSVFDTITEFQRANIQPIITDTFAK